MLEHNLSKDTKHHEVCHCLSSMLKRIHEQSYREGRRGRGDKEGGSEKEPLLICIASRDSMFRIMGYSCMSWQGSLKGL